MTQRDDDDEAQRLRELAEKKIQVQASGVADPPTEPLALLHELQVHQLELEMQNEALQKARIEAEAARDLFAQLYDHAPMAYFNLDSLGEVRRTNLAGGRLLAINRSELTGRHLADFVNEGDRPRLADLIYAMFAGQASGAAELAITTHVGIPRTLRVEACAGEVGPDTCLLAAMDITDLAESRQALMVAASVYETLDEAVMIADAGRRIVSVNPAFTRLTGHAAHEAREQTTDFIRAHLEPADFDGHLERTLSTTGHWQGEIWHLHKNGEHYIAWTAIHVLKDDQGRPMRHITVFRDITEQRRAEEAIWRQANYDPLTDLPNRLLFQDRLRQGITRVLRHGHYLAVMFLDLDKFKEVNDHFGHDVGDAVLVEAARRIRQSVRKSDTLARLSGDEFTVIVEGLSGDTGVDDLADKILAAMDQPFATVGHALSLSASIGVAFCPTDGTELKELLRAADQAMYAAKQGGGRRVQYYSDKGNAAVERRRALMSDLPLALEQGQFSLHFQPIVELDTTRTVMIEALLRWDHPRSGMLPASQFLGLAQECGLMPQIDQWVFQESLAVIKRLNAERGRDQQPLQVAINESAHRYVDAQGVDAWKAQLSASGVAPGSVVIEITERLLQEGGEQVYDWIAQIKDSGMKIALSQFGISRTGIPYLQRYPIDMLKIDHEFVQNMPNHATDQTIVTTLINMAHRLGLRVIAEGVETPEQSELLIAAGCDYAQGHLFGKPLPARELPTSS